MYKLAYTNILCCKQIVIHKTRNLTLSIKMNRKIEGIDVRKNSTIIAYKHNIIKKLYDKRNLRVVEENRKFKRKKNKKKEQNTSIAFGEVV